MIIQKYTFGIQIFSLRPKWVVTVTYSCMNNLCISAIYQNVKLMTHVVPSNDTYKNLLEKLVCDIDTWWNVRQVSWNLQVTWLSHRSFSWWWWWRWSNCFLQILVKLTGMYHVMNLLKNWFQKLMISVTITILHIYKQHTLKN